MMLADSLFDVVKLRAPVDVPDEDGQRIGDGRVRNRVAVAYGTEGIGHKNG